ncbi:MAG: hypothetical protein ACI4QS_05955 [Comamonas sp.]
MPTVLPLAPVLAVGLIATSTSAVAQTSGLQRLPGAHGMQLEMGPRTYRETYKEVDARGGPLMREQADMLGIYGRATWPMKSDWGARVGASYAYGRSDYTGSVWGGSYGSLQAWGVDRHALELQAEAVYAPAAWNGLALSGGLAGRRLTDELDQVAGGYRRVNTGYFALVGVAHDWALSPTWRLQPALQYRYLLRGTQTAATQGGLKFRQNDGHGLELSAQFQQQRSDGSGLHIRPFWRQLEIGASEPSRGFYEPKNSTRELGLDVGWRF